jgi:hypothetical protein
MIGDPEQAALIVTIYEFSTFYKYCVGESVPFLH